MSNDEKIYHEIHDLKLILIFERKLDDLKMLVIFLCLHV